MELVVNGDPVAGPVTESTIADAIRSLDGNDDSFVILAAANQVYIQTAGDPKSGFVLEYRDGSEDQHFTCAEADLTVDLVVQAFQRYLSNDSRWRTDMAWQPHTFGGAEVRPFPMAGLLLIGLAIAGFLLWFLWRG